DVRADQRGGLLRVVVKGLGPHGGQYVLRLRPGHELSDLAGKPVDDRLRDTGRSADTLPVRQCYTRPPLLGEGRNVGKGRDARRPGDPDGPQATALDLRGDVYGIREEEMNVPAHQVHHRGAAALVRNLPRLDARHGVE